MVADLDHDSFIITIAAQLVPILVPNKPRVVVIAQVHGALQPCDCLRPLAKQRVDTADPIGSVAVSNQFWFLTKDAGIDFVSLSAPCIQESRIPERYFISAIAAQFDCASEDWLRFI